MNQWLAALLALIRKEFQSIWRDPKTRVVIVVPPLVQLLVFSFAATLDLNHARLALYNADNGLWSQLLAERLAHASFVQQIDAVHNVHELQARIDNRLDLAGITFPMDASRIHAHGQPVNIQVLIDGRRANSGGILLGYLDRLFTDETASINAGASFQPDLVRLRFRYNPNLNYRWFIVPGIGGILVTFITMLITALSIAREREMGTFDQLLVSPCTPAQIILSKMLPALLIGTLLGLLMVAAGVFVFRLPFSGSLPALLFSLMLYNLSVIGIGLMISALCQTQQQAMLGTFSFVVPSVLMSGFATPTENMPAFLQWLSHGIPLRYYLIVLQGSFLKNLPWSILWTLEIPLMLIAVTTLSLATWWVRRRLQ